MYVAFVGNLACPWAQPISAFQFHLVASPLSKQSEYRECMGLILTELGHGIRSQDDLRKERAWKALLLSSRMLLFHEPLIAGATRTDSMQHRFDLFKGADWQSHWATSTQVARPRPRKQRLVGGCAAEKERHAKACEKVRQAEVSHAAQLLTASPLTNPAQRPPQLARPIPESVLNHTPAEPVAFDDTKYKFQNGML